MLGLWKELFRRLFTEGSESYRAEDEVYSAQNTSFMRDLKLEDPTDCKIEKGTHYLTHVEVGTR
jgi:hypothetical protein